MLNHLEGRLQQATLDLLTGCDIQFRREQRRDSAFVKNHNMAIIFLPAADIPTFVGEGVVSMGITGRDQVAEHEVYTPPTAETGVEEIMDLGFGRCTLQVQVPERYKIKNPRDLIGRNVCTSFKGLTEQYFARLEAEQADLTNGDTPSPQKMRTRIKTLGGSVEVSCDLGVGHAVVDLVGKHRQGTTKLGGCG